MPWVYLVSYYLSTFKSNVMNLIIGIGLIVVWVVYKWRRPKQFRVIELDGQFYLEVKGWLTGIWWSAYAWDDGDISYDDFGTHKAYRSLSEVQKDLDAYAKYISRNKRKKVIKVVYRIEGMINLYNCSPESKSIYV